MTVQFYRQSADCLLSAVCVFDDRASDDGRDWTRKRAAKETRKKERAHKAHKKSKRAAAAEDEH